MKREARFLISRKPFAIDLNTLTATQSGSTGRFILDGHANALWFRRRKGVTVACIGTLHLWAHYLTERVDLDDPHAILSADLDGRYGGDCQGRWDGTGYWGAENPDVQEQHLAILRLMLAKYPALPPGYDGWWTYQAPS
ncbi:hypothetical protein [Streptomyces sp. NPDC001422]|uniref:hypothetical protein n=1 Tax=Streptomyces sp. NPDC001422 TaxID=3364575 RepID=UPI0036C62EBB